MKIRLLSLAALTAATVLALTGLLRSETKDPFTIVGAVNFHSGHPATNRDDGTINVVVEIPAGTCAKWEVTPDGAALGWEFNSKGEPRVVKYLGYPGNYGMIPRTILPEELGGDGDPLDVVALGPARERGSVVKAKLVGVAKFLDDGEQDDKLIAVLAGSALYEASTLAELDARFPGASEIVRLWFSNYKGPGEMEFKGFGDRDEALKILGAAQAAFRNH